MPKKIMIWTGISFLIFFAAFRPGLAADAIRTLGSAAIDILAGIGGFFESLVT